MSKKTRFLTALVANRRGEIYDLEGYAAVEFLDDVRLALVAADGVLCRGGASTLAEIGAMGTPAWVVPYPHHTDRHQVRNARQLSAMYIPITGYCSSKSREPIW